MRKGLGSVVATGSASLRIKVETDPFEIAVLQNENVMYREENRKLKVANAELRMELRDLRRKIKRRTQTL